MDIIAKLTQELNLQQWQTENVVKLLDEGCTVPFIARYRKEQHGTLDDQVIRELSERLEYLRNLDKRREEVRGLIAAQEKLTDEISAALDKALTVTEIDDIYRPFRPKRKTRASVAKEKGLEPLADAIYAQQADSPSPIELAEGYIDPEKGVETAEDALKGALDIIAENISDDPDIRKRLRNLFTVIGTVTVTAADKDAQSVYTMYYDYSEPVKTIAGHRILAIDRGEKEKFLKVSVTIDTVKASNVITSVTLNPAGSPTTEAVREAGSDAYNRLIYPSVEREIRNMLTEKAAAGAIKVFALNTKELLLQPPIKGKTVIGLDPGYRTGCKVAVVDKTGKVLDTGVIYVTHSEAQRNQAKVLIKNLIAKHHANCISIGNGTASKETEIFAAEILREINADVSYMVVSEAGASVYSASKLAAKEFPDYDVNLRSAQRPEEAEDLQASAPAVVMSGLDAVPDRHYDAGIDGGDFPVNTAEAPHAQRLLGYAGTGEDLERLSLRQAADGNARDSETGKISPADPHADDHSGAEHGEEREEDAEALYILFLFFRLHSIRLHSQPPVFLFFLHTSRRTSLHRSSEDSFSVRRGISR